MRSAPGSPDAISRPCLIDPPRLSNQARAACSTMDSVKLGGPGVSDDEFLLRTIMKGEDEIRAMRAAGPPRQYYYGAAPLVTLLEELGKHRQVRYVRVERGGDSVVVRNRTSA